MGALEAIPSTARALRRAWVSIRKAGCEDAVEHWLATSARGLDPGSRDRGLIAWGRAVRRGAGAERHQRLFAFFTSLAARGAIPPTPLTRFLLRVALRNPQLAWWPRLRAAVRDPDLDEAALKESARAVRDDARTWRAACMAGRVEFGEVHAELLGLCSLLPPRAQALRLQPTDDLGVSSQYRTDGEVLPLPARMELSPQRAVNDWAYLLTLLREAELVEGGLFHLTPTSPGYVALWERLEPRREAFLRRDRAWRAARDARARERRHTCGDTALRDRAMRPAQAICSHFPHPRAFLALWLIVEDARLVPWLQVRHPGLAAIDELVERHRDLLRPHATMRTPEQNLRVAVEEYTRGRRVTAHVHRAYEEAWTVALEVLDAVHASPPVCPAESAVIAARLWDILEDAMPGMEDPAGASPMAEALSEGIDDRQIELSEQDISDWAGQDPEVARGRAHITYPSYQELPPRPERDHRYPEWDAWQGRPIRDAVALQELRWEPTRRAWSAPAVPPTAALSGPAWDSCSRLAADLANVRTGVDLDISRLHDLLGALRAGHQGDDRVFRRRVRRSEPTPGTVSFLVDLSVSMERPRPGATLPLLRAIQLLQQLVPAIEGAGVPVGIFGADDQGRRSIDFHVVKDHREPFEPQRVAGLHAVRAGGFRFGAAVRHLDARLRRQGDPGPHLVVLLMDCGSYYLCKGADRVEATLQHRCTACQHRAACNVEPTRPQLQLPDMDLNVFYPSSYAFADLGHAVADAPGMEVVACMLDIHQPAARLDRVFGAGSWVRLMSTDDLPSAAAMVEGALRRRGEVGRGRWEPSSPGGGLTGGRRAAGHRRSGLRSGGVTGAAGARVWYSTPARPRAGLRAP
ncbi:MAG: hypothetical protein ABIO70_23270 [Pseudomonadota bacterium]